MIPLFNVTATLEDEKTVVINSNIFADNSEKREALPQPWWATVTAAFVFDDRIAVVKRSGNTVYANCWALIPAGTSDRIEEVRIENPIEYSTLLTKSKMRVVDKANNQVYEDCGELFMSDRQLFFARVYQFDIPLETLRICDGELHKGKPLNREVRLVSLDELLSLDARTPTLRWAQDKLPRVLSLLES